MNWYITIFFFELYIFGNAIHDYWLIKKNDTTIATTHKYEALKQGCVILFFSLMSGNYYFLSFDWIGFGSNVFLYLTIFWLQFDYTLNHLRKKYWWHLGNAWFDRILKGYNLRFYRLGLKVVLFCIALLLKFILK